MPSRTTDPGDSPTDGGARDGAGPASDGGDARDAGDTEQPIAEANGGSVERRDAVDRRPPGDGRTDGDRAGLGALVSGVRVGQFVSVGAVGATAETLLVAALTAGYGVVPQLAKAVGAEVSITLMFLLNDRWTFAEEGVDGSRSLLYRYGRSHVVRLGGLVVGFTVLTLLTDFTDVTLVVAGADFWPTVANGIGIVFGMVLNYVFESVFTWRVHR